MKKMNEAPSELNARGREIQEITKNTDSMIEQTKRFLIIKNESDLQNSAEALVRIVRAKKELTEKRMSITRSMDEAKRRIMDLFRMPTEKIEGIEKAVKESISKWHERQEAEREKARQEAIKAEKKAQFLEGKGDIAKAEEIRQESAIAGAGISDKEKGVRMVWKFEIVEPEQVPFQLCSPDEKKIRERVTQTNGREIAGIKIWKERSIIAR